MKEKMRQRQNNEVDENPLWRVCLGVIVCLITFTVSIVRLQNQLQQTQEEMVVYLHTGKRSIEFPLPPKGLFRVMLGEEPW